MSSMTDLPAKMAYRPLYEPTDITGDEEAALRALEGMMLRATHRADRGLEPYPDSKYFNEGLEVLVGAFRRGRPITSSLHLLAKERGYTE